MGVDRRIAAFVVLTAVLAVALAATAFDVSAEEHDGKVLIERTGQYYDSIAEAFDAEKSRGTVDMIIFEGEYEFDITFDKCDVSITGQGENSVLKNTRNWPDEMLKTITLKNLTYYPPQGEYMPFPGFEGLGEYYYNVSIIHTLTTWCKTAIFENCSFFNDTDELYALHSNSTSNLVVNECTFDVCGRAALVYNTGNTESSAVIKNTVFNDDGEREEKKKAAIEIHTEMDAAVNERKFVVTIQNCTADGFKVASSSNSNLWASYNNTGGKETSKSALVIVDDITKLIPEGVEAVVVGENGAKQYATLTDAFKEAGGAADGDTVVLLKDADMTTQDFPDITGRTLTITGTKTQDETTGEITTTKLKVGTSIPASAYKRLVIESDENLVTTDGAAFCDCEIDATIQPSANSTIVNNAQYHVYSGYLIAGTVVFGAGATEEDVMLAEGCIIENNKILCKMYLDAGDGTREEIHLAYGEAIPDLKEIPERAGYTFMGFSLFGRMIIDGDGKALVDKCDFMPESVLEAQWIEGEPVEEGFDWVMPFVAILVIIVVGGALILAFKS